MSDIAIQVEDVSKRYRLGARAASYGTLRDSLTGLATAPLRLGRSVLGRPGPDDMARGEREFWALRDVSFTVRRGEVLGIIGRNGAGKSTLLKVLSRITEPTRGRIRIRGRVASLLEVGTGFHAELTGRENIYLNGAILGMSRAEVQRKFDEIVAFSEVEQFIDTQVKYYSSGMYLRLAFSVAAHLDPEILIVDEVLAVGDAAFQKKSLGKMSEATRAGRTVLFVSHNMAAVENLCRRGLVLQQGTPEFEGTQTEAVARYLALNSAAGQSLQDRPDRGGNGEVRIVHIETRDIAGNLVDVLRSGMDVDFYLHFECRNGAPVRNVNASIGVFNLLGTPIFLQHNRMTGDNFGVLPNRGIFVCRIPCLPLPAATYTTTCSLIPAQSDEYLDFVENAFEFTVVNGDFFRSGEVPPSTHGLALVHAAWRLERE